MNKHSVLPTLIKKQLTGLFSGGGKSGKKSKKGMTVLFAVLMLYVFGVIAMMFFTLMASLAEPLTALGLDWLCFTYADIVAVVLSVVTGAFAAQTQLYGARDNELLLSLPIKPSYILLSRMIPLYLENLLFSALVLVPTYLAYGIYISFTSPVAFILKLLLIPLFSLSLCCLAGFLLAWVMSRVRHKNLINVILSLLFMAAYYLLCSRFMNCFELIAANSEKIGGVIRGRLYLVYALGRSSLGDLTASLLSFGLIILVFVIAYAALSKSYIRIITTSRGVKSREYRGGKLKVSTPSRALLGRELTRFVTSPVYLLNCGLGTVMLLVASVMLLIKGKELTEFLVSSLPGMEKLIPLMFLLLVSFVSSMNAVSASSVSLEGKSLYLIRSLPVKSDSVLRAKLSLHFLVTAPAAVLCSVIFTVIFRVPPLTAVMLIVLPAVLVLLYGEIGLLMNLRFPMLDWDNEAYPVKRSMSAGMTLLIGMGMNMLFIPLYIILGGIVSEVMFMALVLVFVSAASLILYLILRKRGAAMLESVGE